MIPFLLGEPAIAAAFGRIEALVLHPAAASLRAMATWDELEAKTAENCTRRGDDPQPVKRRTASIREEAPAWKSMVEKGACEHEAWPFPEHIFRREGLAGPALLAHQIGLLLNAKATLVARCPRLAIFFKTDDETRKISSPIVA